MLRIQSESHLLAHPPRGALFENLVVAETLKFFRHRARRAALHFYRDSDGNEVDLLIELASGVFHIEVKAGETVNPDFFRGLRAFARRYDPPPPNGGALVYGGTDSQQRNGAWVLPPERLPDLLAPLAGA